MILSPVFFSTVNTTNLQTYAGDYRFGFNGQEKDNEIKGIGNSLSFKHRVYDSRLGKFLSVDPLSSSSPWNSTYSFASNKPISGIDLAGLEYYYTSSGELLGKYGKSNKIRVVDFKYSYLATEESMLNAFGKGARSFFEGKLNKKGNDYFEKTFKSHSIPGYRKTKENEQFVIKRWAAKNQNVDREYGMSLFSRKVDKPEGGGQIEIFVEGTRAQGEDYVKGSASVTVSLENSTPPESYGGWKRWTSIHTHPRGGSRDFSNQYGGINFGGDMQGALYYGVGLYLVPPTGSTMGLFSPRNYAKELRKWDEEGYYKGRSDEQIVGDSDPASPHHKRDAEMSIKNVKFKE